MKALVQSSGTIHMKVDTIECLSVFQRLILVILTWTMGLVIMLATIDLVYIILTNMISPPTILLDINELLDIFGHFLLIMIGIELLETLKIYLEEHVINVQVVLLVAIIAIARKVIILDVKTLPSLTLIGIGVVIIALSVGYYLVKKSQTYEKCKIL